MTRRLGVVTSVVDHLGQEQLRDPSLQGRPDAGESPEGPSDPRLGPARVTQGPLREADHSLGTPRNQPPAGARTQLHRLVDLGLLDPGDTITLIYQIDARAYTGVPDPTRPEFVDPPTVGVQALIEDPFSLDAGFFLNDQSFASLVAGPGGPAPGVPGPAAWLLLCCGLAAVAARRRKQR